MFKRSEKIERNLDQDVSLLADTLDGVLQSSRNRGHETAEAIRSRAEDVLRNSRARLHEVPPARELAGKAKSALKDNPWKGVGLGAAVGVVVGILLARR
ncbi:YqjD family protein [Nissabacter sp. SGAir0207]|uniref:DUF883 family protein n=1 Tax=Nissabacter sp. SGAir0207 TaxID=2126321 RepID=UPI0010CCC34E|nr:DUF883 family protein [Nissabacter sp. SGAir0207]QCR35234.1 hypothetical protein C1N62_03610 [Nissabacter sp. SGAir0207]